jgi:hypothetical protein
MARQGNAKKVLLGEGVFKIGTVAVGFTRGGGQFTVERKVRQIDADGDKGIYVGRNAIESSIPKLKLNPLQIIGDNISKLYAGIDVAVDTPTGSTTVTGTGTIATEDYLSEVSWTGKTLEGKEVVIKVYNAINLEGIDWKLADKDEVIQDVTFTGCYQDDSPEDYEPWDIIYAN